MVSALPLCLLVLAATVVSSQEISDEEQFAERRTFKHKKPVKILPLIKKHKKFGGWLPSVFGKTEYAEVPVYQEIPLRPIYKFQRYQGIEVKPVSDVHVSGPESADSHSVVPSTGYAPAYTSVHDYTPDFDSDHSFPPAPPPTSFVLYPLNDKHVFSGPSFSNHVSVPSAPVFDSRPVLSYLPSPPPPVIPSPVPISLPPVSVFSTVSIPKPAPTPIISAPIHPPVLPAPLPPSFALPLPAPVPPLSFTSPILPPPSPAPVFPSVPVIPSSSPIISSLPALPPLSIPPSPQPEFPYPPSGTPIPSYIKDISLPEISVTPTPTPTSVTVVTPHYEEVTSTVSDDHNTKTFDHGLFQKLKDWKAEKANQALSHLSYFKPKPTLATPHAHPVQFPNPLPLTPDFRPPPVFFPQSAPVFSPHKYENFPPNNIESPPLFNSYGAPIPHDSYSVIHHTSHDRLSPEASEEEPSVLPPPQTFDQPQPETNPIEFKKPEPQNFKTQFQPQALLQEQPIYVPEDNQKVNQDVVALPTRNSQPEEPEDGKHHKE